MATQELHLSEGARQIFEGFERELEPRLGQFGDLLPIADWGSKLAGAIGRIAGVLHLVVEMEDYLQRRRSDGNTRTSRERPSTYQPSQAPIAGATMESAIQIGRYLIEHARLGFAMMGTGHATALGCQQDAQYALDWIGGSAKTKFTKRELYKSNKNRFRRVADVGPVLELLVDRHIVRRDEEPSYGPRGGRPSEVYIVNPKVLRNSPARAENPASDGAPSPANDAGGD